MSNLIYLFFFSSGSETKESAEIPVLIQSIVYRIVV